MKSIDKDIDLIPHKFLDCEIQETTRISRNQLSHSSCSTARQRQSQAQRWISCTIFSLWPLDSGFLELCNALAALPVHTASRRVLTAQIPNTQGVLDDAGRDYNTDVEQNAAPAANAPRALPPAYGQHDFKMWHSCLA